jgi:hypothetical protein
MPDRARGQLVLNPTLQLTAVVDVSRRGKGRRQVEVTDPRAVRFLLSWVARGGRRPHMGRALRRRLIADGILVRPAEVPRDVHLDPRLASSSLGLSAGSRLSRGPALPPDIARRSPIAEPFLPAEDILWVRRVGSGIELPYTLAPDLARAVHKRGVGTSGDCGDVFRELAAWRRQVRDWRRELRTCGYAILRGLFTPIFVAAVREYYRRLEREGYLIGGDDRRRGRPLIYDEPLLAFLGGQLAAVVGQITRERVPSTFSFLRVYDPGAVLERHRDRPACRWNIDLVVGGDPPPERRTAWPLWIDGRQGRHAVRLGLGDGVLYRGTELRHWRRAQPAGRTTVLACFHYGRAGPRP